MRTAVAVTAPAFPPESRYHPDYGLKCYIHRDVPFPPCASAGLCDASDRFPLHRSDVTVVGYPKSGTNWLQVMVGKLYDDDWGTLELTDGVVPHVEMASRDDLFGYEHSILARSPRLMKAHIPPQVMPSAFRDRNVGKVLYVARNPKDVCDSYFDQLDARRAYLGMTLDWPEFVARFASGRMLFGSWLEHVLAWRERGEDRGVLHLEFETMRKDVAATLRRVVDFLERPVAPGQIERVIEATGFARMQTGAMARLYNGPVVRRAGRSGGWRNRFTVAQNDLFDREIVSVLERKGMFFDYG